MLIYCDVGSAMRAKTLLFFKLSKCPTKYGIQQTISPRPRHFFLGEGRGYSVTGINLFLVNGNFLPHFLSSSFESY